MFQLHKFIKGNMDYLRGNDIIINQSDQIDNSNFIVHVNLCNNMSLQSKKFGLNVNKRGKLCNKDLRNFNDFDP